MFTIEIEDGRETPEKPSVYIFILDIFNIF